MEVILLERIEKLGQMGDVVKVKPGFARNYLLPQRKALRATKGNISHFEGRRAQLEADNLKRREEATAVAKKLDGLKVVIVRQASDTDQLYGSVTPRDIADAVTAAGFTVEKRQVTLDRPIKTVGLHSIRVVLHPEVIVTVTTNVARSEEEAEAQSRGERIVRDQGEEPVAPVDTADMFEPGIQPTAEAAEAKREPENA